MRDVSKDAAIEMNFKPTFAYYTKDRELKL